MNKQAVNAADFEKKILGLVKNRNYKNFIKAPAAVGAALGGVGGGAIGAYEGLDDPNSKGLVHNALSGGLHGAAIGGSLGAAKGLGMRRDLIKKQLQEVENRLGRPGMYQQLGNWLKSNHDPVFKAEQNLGRLQKAKGLWEEMASTGKLNDVNILDHLHGSEGLVEKGMSKALGQAGFLPKSPEELMANREKLEEGLRKFMGGGGLASLESAGLSEAEKSLLKSKYKAYMNSPAASEARKGARKEMTQAGSSMADVRAVKPKEIEVPIAAKANNIPAIADFNNLESQAREEVQKEIDHASRYPQYAETHFSKAQEAHNKAEAFGRINKLRNKYQAALEGRDPGNIKYVHDELMNAISTAQKHIPKA